MYEKVRTSPNKPNAGEQHLDFVRMMCEITATDLTEFFSRWGYLNPFDESIDDYGSGKMTINQQCVDELVEEIKGKNYTPMTEKIEYICDSNWEIYKKRLNVQAGSASKNGLVISTNGWKNVVAYEAYDEDRLAFVSNLSSFTLDAEPKALKIYAIAYDGTRTEVKW